MNADAVALARARTWATVDLDALEHNVRLLAARAPAALMAVVKADAYGHGAVAVARAALAAGAVWLGVAAPEEALELRAAGVDARLLILGSTAPAWLERVGAAGCEVTASGVADIAAVGRLGPRARPRVHIEVDTGMTRGGATLAQLPDVVVAAARAGVAVAGVSTHLACADDQDSAATRAQLARFAEAVRVVRARFPSALAHAAASAGLVGFPDAALDLVRPGIALYGVPPAPHLDPGLRPVMAVRSRVVRVLRVPAGTPVSYGATYRAATATTIATVPVGYADGYPRQLSGQGVMMVGGRRHPVAGRVCMDYTMLDVGDAAVHEGDEVLVFGEELPAVEVAAAAGTIAYELLCRLGRRVPRVYLRGGRPVAVAAAWVEQSPPVEVRG
ncbi:MAG: alanine racemase [Armatimonadota bacterium]|nr:alanine racemase [Armatimonadota bacterium]MDR7457867.1 alanine racemase [Armatimonadota bacterium]MDR7497312.1 alanine racemase [Armatimonadota bacterium]